MIVKSMRINRGQENAELNATDFFNVEHWRKVKSVTYLNIMRVGFLWFDFSFFVLINMVCHNYILFNHVSA